MHGILPRQYSSLAFSAALRILWLRWPGFVIGQASCYGTITRSKCIKCMPCQPGEPGKPTKGSWELGPWILGSDRIPGPTNCGIDSPSLRNSRRGGSCKVIGEEFREFATQGSKRKMRQLPNEPFRWGSYFETPEP